MSWLGLIEIYAGIMILALLLSWKRFAGKRGRLIRTLLSGTLLLFLGELVAEERGLWFIPASSGIFFMSAPVEGAILVLATLLNSLLPYVLLARTGPGQSLDMESITNNRENRCEAHQTEDHR